MKKLKFALAALMAFSIIATASAQYQSNSVRLLSQIPLTGFPGSPGNGSGCVGYTSPSGKEYAIIGLKNGNAVVNITNPFVPVIVGHIPGVQSTWHEVCVLGAYAYACTEGGQGVQIIDLTQVDNGVVSLAGTLTIGGLSRGHTVQAMPSSNLLFVHGGDINGLRAYDCTNPTAPVSVGSWTGKYVHDAQFVKYTSGPYAGKEICFACCANGSNGGLYIIDVTTTVNGQGQHVPAMQTLGFLHYFPTGVDNFYCHSGSLTPDKRFFLINDEFDESNSLVPNCSTHIVNVENLAAPTYVNKFVNPINVIDHNSMVQDNFLMLAAYRGGLRIYDIANTPTITEVGFFDTFPTGNGFAYEGAWGTWTGYASGNVIISDINRGLFVVDPSEAMGFGAPIVSVAHAGTSGEGDGVKGLRKNDDQEFTVFTRSGKGDMIATLQTTAATKTKLDVSMRARSAAGPLDNVVLQVKNQTTGLFESIGTWGMTTTEGLYEVTNLDGTKYIATDGTIVIKMQLRTTNQSGVKVFADMLRAKAHG